MWGSSTSACFPNVQIHDLARVNFATRPNIKLVYYPMMYTEAVVRKALKNIESVIMIIPDRKGGGSTGLRVFFFNAPNLIAWLY